MKKIIAVIMLALSVPVFAGYTYTITDGMDLGGLTLTGTDSLLMTGGKCNTIYSTENSYVKIENTDQSVLYPYQNRAIFKLSANDNSNIDIFDGALHDVYSNKNAIVNVFGGNLHAIVLDGNSIANVRGGVIGDGILVKSDLCSVHIYGYNLGRSGVYISGNWADGTPFSLLLREKGQIVLHEIPEPVGMLLLALGGILIRKK